MKELKNTRKYTPKELEALKEAVFVIEDKINETSLKDLANILHRYILLNETDQSDCLHQDYREIDLRLELEEKFGPFDEEN